MEENKELSYIDKIKCTVQKELEQLVSKELDTDTLDMLYKLVDIDKDLANMDYWNVKKEVMQMRYNDYGDYSEGRYGRRGVPGSGRGRYRGHNYGEEMLDEMREHYGEYSESMSAYSRGNYNAGQDGMRALENAMEIFTEFSQKMIREAETPEEKQIIKKYLRKISQMGDM